VLDASALPEVDEPFEVPDVPVVVVEVDAVVVPAVIPPAAVAPEEPVLDDPAAEPVVPLVGIPTEVALADDAPPELVPGELASGVIAVDELPPEVVAVVALELLLLDVAAAVVGAPLPDPCTPGFDELVAGVEAHAERVAETNPSALAQTAPFRERRVRLCRQVGCESGRSSTDIVTPIVVHAMRGAKRRSTRRV
jgi:hypothetical protein